MIKDPPRNGEGDHAQHSGGGAWDDAPHDPSVSPAGRHLIATPTGSLTGRILGLAIVDLSYGNIGSIAFAFERLGCTPLVTADPDALAAASHIILPGVGAAGFAMNRIDALNLREPLRAAKQPVLGICLGMQLLYDRSEEDDTACIGVVPGTVRKLDAAPDRPVPHMGWSQLSVRDEAVGLADGDYVYFAHSYACDDGPDSLATADYGGPIPAVVRHGNFIGAQFHPERSGDAGARFLEAFLNS